jgi:site-specific DNA-methyltransferase (adenine-specific)
MIKGETYTVHIGNNLDILPTLPDNSVDSIVTDPPYELGFMGKKWDSSGIAYSVELWRECLRVLKPGGHLLSFGGTRTWHRVAVGIEDAGFEVRDSIAWMYGSGFPKSLDVSKAIDKATGENKQRQLEFVNWMRSTGITAKQINDATATHMASHYIGLSQPAIATADLFDKLRPYLPEVPEEIERLVAERTGIEWTEYRNRKVISEKPAYGIGATGRTFGGHSEGAVAKESLPATPEAQQWEGWGTALKPAFEPIVVARKPLIGTVAENVLTHGTGALNIDGSRIGTSKPNAKNTSFNSWRDLEGREDRQEPEQTYDPNQGRWPANVILDEYSAEVLDEQSDASRFYYVAKASKRDRNEGLEELPAVRASAMGYDIGLGEAGEGMFKDRNPQKQNFHPTVKPTQLMRYLVKLVTPPGGTVLDPFTGSGSTGKAAILEGFTFIGCELTEDYIPIIEGRLKHAEQMASEAKDKEDEALF